MREFIRGLLVLTLIAQGNCWGNVAASPYWKKQLSPTKRRNAISYRDLKRRIPFRSVSNDENN